MKNVLTISFFFFLGGAFGQGGLDTIYANEHYNVTLFFPSPVKQAAVGAGNYTFSFNEETPQHLGLLKARPGPQSNLLVLTTDGSVYSYLLQYRKYPIHLNHFLKEEQRLGLEIPESVHQKDKEKLASIKMKSKYENKLKNLCLRYIERSRGSLKTRRKNGIILQVENLFYYQDKTFMVLELRNKSGINFELKPLKIFIRRGMKSRNATFQSLPLDPCYTFRFPDTISDQSKKKFVLVFDKFTLGSRDKLSVSLRERRGSRNLTLQFRPQF